MLAGGQPPFAQQQLRARLSVPNFVIERLGSWRGTPGHRARSDRSSCAGRRFYGRGDGGDGACGGETAAVRDVSAAAGLPIAGAPAAAEAPAPSLPVACAGVPVVVVVVVVVVAPPPFGEQPVVSNARFAAQTARVSLSRVIPP